MSAFKDLTGLVYGRLTCVSIARGKNGRAFWNCECSCGIKKIVSGKDIRSGNTKSCGCLKGEHFRGIASVNRKKFGEAALNYVVRKYREGARRRGLSFDITSNDVAWLVKQRCWYCGANPTLKEIHRPMFGDLVQNGIDRKDSSLGYSIQLCSLLH